MLIVEGADDEHVVAKLLARHELSEKQPFDIERKDGFSELHASIYNEVNASQRRALGILADADDDIDSRWQSIADQLAKAKCQVPDGPDPDGTILSGPRKMRVGVWLMPDNRNSGELEDFIVGMVPDSDAAWPRAEQYIDGIPAAQRKFKPGKRTRACVHAWLATRERPRPMGLAIATGDLRHDAPVPASFVAWLRKLFCF